ncbi:MAG TPA: PepSY domain-containing protein [Burkholderiales bacterium]|nr:PepSY domain-containing protein [Burkholderiales bacterium]
MSNKLIGTMAIALFLSPVAYADMHSDALGACLKAGLSAYPGKAVSVRFEIEGGKHQYEVDIKGNDGKSWEVECDAKTGKVLQVEREVKADDPEFTSKAKVRLDAALKTALDRYPGSVMKIEYEIEKGGNVAYEFDIKSSGGRLLEVEVDAVTGELKDSEEVLWHIGK